jgi:hypothetical protein
MKRLNQIVLFACLLRIFSCGDDSPEYILKQFDTRFDKPHQINVLLQVLSSNGKGVSDLDIDDFIIIEDNNLIGLEHDAELVHYNKDNNVNITIQTIILIDVSKSMSDKLSDLKEAAIALVEESPDYQSFAIYTFSSTLELIQPLTLNKKLVERKLRSIQLGTSSTNLYGSLRDIGKIMRKYPNVQTLEKINVTNLICFSDGDDTRGTVKADEAIISLKGLNAYLMGTGDDLNKSALSKLGIYYPLNSTKQVKKMFLKIQNEIQDVANSYYWLLYQTPKRGDFNRSLIISLEDEPNTNVQIKFNSKYFTD